MKIKQGTRVPPGIAVAIALQIAEGIYKQYAAEVIITSGRDGEHKRGSAHYRDGAVDLRIWNVGDSETTWRKLAKELARALGDDFDVVLHGKDDPPPHIHIEYDPKAPL